LHRTQMLKGKEKKESKSSASAHHAATCHRQLKGLQDVDGLDIRQKSPFRRVRTKEKAPPKPWRDQHIGTRGEGLPSRCTVQYGLPSPCTRQKFPPRPEQRKGPAADGTTSAGTEHQDIKLARVSQEVFEQARAQENLDGSPISQQALTGAGAGPANGSSRTQHLTEVYFSRWRKRLNAPTAGRYMKFGTTKP
jgi:hypothetical protein